MRVKTEHAGSLYDLLPRRFRPLVDRGDFQYHYALEQTYPGTRILHHDPEKYLTTISFDGGIPVVRLRQDPQTKWLAFRNDRLAEDVPTPAAWIPPALPNLDLPRPIHAVKSDDGRWALLEDAGELRLEKGKLVSYPLRYLDLATGHIADVPLPPEYGRLDACGWLASKNCFLVNLPDGPYAHLWWFFDPSTATLTRALGDLEPLSQWSGQTLQPAVQGGFWLATVDNDSRVARIGRYDFRNLTFQVVFKIPDIYVDNDHFWVDDANHRLLLVANGDLLSIPLPN